MGAISTGRVIGGGLLAGLILAIVELLMNRFLVGDDWSAVYAKLGLAEPSGGAIGAFIALAFMIGMLIAWVYAAIRPRLGAGPATAAKTATVVWVAAFFYPTLQALLLGAFTTRLAVITLAYTLVAVVAAGLAAGAVYQEAETATP